MTPGTGLRRMTPAGREQAKVGVRVKSRSQSLVALRRRRTARSLVTEPDPVDDRFPSRRRDTACGRLPELAAVGLGSHRPRWVDAHEGCLGDHWPLAPGPWPLAAGRCSAATLACRANRGRVQTCSEPLRARRRDALHGHCAATPSHLKSSLPGPKDEESTIRCPPRPVHEMLHSGLTFPDALTALRPRTSPRCTDEPRVWRPWPI